MSINRIDEFLARFGLIRKRQLENIFQQGYNISKLLDEHRETVEEIGEYSTLFTDRPWLVGQLKLQDDNLMSLFKLVHGRYPEEFDYPPERPHVRDCPKVFGDQK